MEGKILILISNESKRDFFYIQQYLKEIGNMSDLEFRKDMKYVLCIIEMAATISEVLYAINLIKKNYAIPICVFEENIFEDYPGEKEKLKEKADIIVGRTFVQKDFFLLLEQLMGLKSKMKCITMETNTGTDLIKVLPDCRKLYINSVEINLTKKEFNIFHYLFQKKGIVVTPKELYENVWKQEYISDDTNIMAHIHRLRYKVEDDPKNPKYICNQYSVGYYFGV